VSYGVFVMNYGNCEIGKESHTCSIVTNNVALLPAILPDNWSSLCGRRYRVPAVPLVTVGTIAQHQMHDIRQEGFKGRSVLLLPQH